MVESQRWVLRFIYLSVAGRHEEDIAIREAFQIEHKIGLENGPVNFQIPYLLRSLR